MLRLDDPALPPAVAARHTRGPALGPVRVTATAPAPRSSLRGPTPSTEDAWGLGALRALDAALVAFCVLALAAVVAFGLL